MLRYTFLKIRVLAAAALFAAVCLLAQKPAAPVEDAQNKGVQGLPPRATPADYQAQTKAGMVTIAAEFSGHSVPTPEGPLSTEDYVVVETGLFGPPDARVTLSPDDFSLRINGKKAPSPSQPYGLVVKSLKDPTWEPPVTASAPTQKSKTSMSTGGGQGDSGATPEPVKIPIEVQRAMAKRTQKASLPEGDRALPQAGLLFFEYRGKVRSAELIYGGPAGKATLTLQP
jgi:hypothetical protein